MIIILILIYFKLFKIILNLKLYSDFTLYYYLIYKLYKI